MQNKKLIAILKEDANGHISKFIVDPNLTLYETSSVETGELKHEYNDHFFDFVSSMAKTLNRAEQLIRDDLVFVTNGDEYEKVMKEFNNMSVSFFDHISRKISKSAAKEKKVEKEKMHLEKGETSFQKIFGFNDESMVIFYKLGGHYCHLKDYPKARDIFLLLLTLNPLVSTYWIALGVCWQREGNYEEALTYFKNAAIINEHNPSPDLYAASCYYEMGKKSDALEQIEMAKSKFNALSHEETTYWEHWMSALKHKYKA